MATITSHLLNGVDGSHAGDVEVALFQIGQTKPTATSRTDDGGRLSIDVAAENLEPEARYELVFQTGHYWRGRGFEGVISEIVLRFEMTDSAGGYHMPVIISPFSYSTWKSG